MFDTGDTSERHLPEVGSSGAREAFDYDIPPEALADEQFAAIIAKAEKYFGYPYVWGRASPSTSFDCSGCCPGDQQLRRQLIRKADCKRFFLGVCTPVSSADAKPGNLIFFQGTYNTSGASHVGSLVGNGMMIHCGVPDLLCQHQYKLLAAAFLYISALYLNRLEVIKLNPKIEKLEKEIKKTKTKMEEVQAKP